MSRAPIPFINNYALIRVSDGGWRLTLRNVVKISKKGGKDTATLIHNDSLPKNTTAVYISGAVPELDDAVEEIPEEFSEENGVTLFYYPPLIVNHLGIWKSPSHSKPGVMA